tara:strand:- start:4823 stop:6157 length:1335 start_codon:yes stop_codon:yes gene_type:complete
MTLSKNDLIDWFEKGSKNEKEYKIGTEHEKFVYKLSNLEPVTYNEKSGIRNILKSLIRFGWKEVIEEGFIIALKKDKQSITLEPGGQLELSGAPLQNIHKTCSEVNDHLDQLKIIGNELKIGFLGIGARIEGKLPNEYWMPKARYNIMKEYMPKVGEFGLEMMADTCTVQVNLDYSSENDMMRKVKSAFILQPIISALFASSSLENMKTSKFLSRRSAIWFDVDKARCGVPEFIFNNNFGFEEWVDYALNVPMYFVRRNGKYINCAGESFKNFMQGNLKSLKNDEASLSDWEDHLSTIFTEVRLKQFIEFRGADAGPWKSLCALPAIWVGMLYNKNALNEIEALANSISRESFIEMYLGGPIEGLSLEINGKKLNDYAKDIISIAKNGLKNRAIKDSAGNDESGYLNQLEEIAFSGKNQAKRMLEIWNEDKENALSKIYKTYSY